MKKTCTHFAGHFDGSGGALVGYCMHHPMKKVQGFERSHWTLQSGKYCSQLLQSVMHTPVFFEFFHRQLIEKRSRVEAKAPINNKGMTY
jgi:hypothetical protein